MEHLLNYKEIQEEILQLIRSSQEPLKIWPELAFMLAKIFQVDTCLIFPWFNGIDSLNLGFWSVKEGKKLLSCEQKENIALNALRLKSEIQVEPWLVSGGQISELEEFIPNLNLSSQLAIATKIQGNTNGLIILGDLKPHEWTNLETEVIKIVSSLVALIISVSELWQSTPMMSSYQTSIMNFTRENFGNTDVNSSLNFTLAGIAQVIQAHRGLIFRLKYNQPILPNRLAQSCPQGEVEVVAHWSSFKEQSLLNYSFALSDSPLCQWAWQNAPQVTSISDQEEVLKITHLEDTESVFQLKNQSASIIAPLLNNYNTESSSSVVLGFLILQNDSPRSWENKEIDLVKWAGIQAGMAIIHEQTLQRVQSMVEERNARLKWMLEFQTKLNEKRQNDLEKMRHLNQVKDEFIDNLSDTLRHPLTKIKMAIEMLKLVSHEQQRQRYLEILEVECAKEINLINDLLTLQKLQSDKFKSQNQKVNLKDITDDLASSFQQWKAKGLDLKIEYPEKMNNNSAWVLYTDPEILTRIINELLTNAGKFASPNTEIYLQISQEFVKEQNQIIIKVTDTGIGISSEEQTYIFQPFRRGQNLPNASNQGTGMGLALVKSLIEHLNGTIEVFSEPTHDSSLSLTCFTVTIPMVKSQQQ